MKMNVSFFAIMLYDIMTTTIYCFVANAQLITIIHLFSLPCLSTQHKQMKARR